MKWALIILAFLTSVTGTAQTDIEKQIIEIVENRIPMNTTPEEKQTRVLTDLNVYPNPASNVLTITFNLAADVDFQCEIVDLKGNVVLGRRFGGLKGDVKGQIYIAIIPDGLYILRVVAGSEKYTRLIKKIK